MPAKMRTSHGPLLLFTVVWLVLVGRNPADAAVVFSSFAVGDTYDSFNGYEIEGPASALPQAVAEQFQPQASFYLDSVDLALSSSNAGPDLRVEVYEDSGGIPGNLLKTTQVGDFANGIVSVDFGGSVILTGGTNYWLGVFAEGASLFTWHDSLSPEFAWQAVTEDEGTNWLSFSSDQFPGSALRINGTSVAPPDVSLIDTGQAWRYTAGLEEPSVGTAWATTAFDDSSWYFDLEGFGYDDDLATQAGLLSNVLTELSGMRDNGINADAHTSLYLRREFTVVDPLELSDLVLQLDYDDSFIAYINGVEVARSAFGTVGTPEPFDALGTDHESTNGDANLALERFVIDLVDDFPGLLSAGGNNVVAIQGLNSALDDDDFVLSQISLGGNWFPLLSPGDGNGDGKVDGLDYLVWAGNYGDNPADDPPGSPQNGDYNNDGLVDGLDYLVWASNYLQGPNDSTAVPEPGALVLLVMGALGAISSPRRRRFATPVRFT